MKLKDLIEKYGEQEVLCWAERADESLEWVNIKLGKPNPKTVWDLEKGDRHCWVDITGAVCTDVKWRDDEEDKLSRAMGYVFLTEEEANKEVERRKVETLLLKHGGRRWYKKFGENFGFLIDDVNRFGIHSLNQIQGTIYFDTYSDAKTALDSIGADRIKKALFEVR